MEIKIQADMFSREGTEVTYRLLDKLVRSLISQFEEVSNELEALKLELAKKQDK